MELETILSQLTREERIALGSGMDFWHTKDLSRLGLPAAAMADGPHGLRKQVSAGDMLGVKPSLPATCFPAAVTTACSWDPELLEELGRAVGQEARDAGVAVILGPGVNIKRNPLCGRNFEYFSEDPLLAGRMGAAWIRGAQSAGTDACVKHFACNSQEYKRFVSDSVVDPRALREIYLAPFEIAVKEGRPAAVMSAYNKLNGVHCSDNAFLLTQVLRQEWGFSGVVMTDWGGMGDRIRGFQAGCDLMMPGGSAYQEEACLRAVEEGRLDPDDVDRSARRVLALMAQAAETGPDCPPLDREAHHALARRAAAESAVLLKNRGALLPLSPHSRVVFLGAMASKPQFQGTGSSQINPWRIVSPAEACPGVPVVPGCDEAGETTAELLAEAVEAARSAETAVVFVGLPAAYESEGFDRSHMALPPGHNQLVEAVAAANPNTVVVLQCGSPVELPWADQVGAILYLGLSGQAVGEAAADLLFGRAVPGGKLAETWPLSLRDCPCASFWGEPHRDGHYRESVYVGYRYYASAGVPVRFPFGHGLSYTTFALRDLSVREGQVFCTVKNTGTRRGSEVVQVYLSPEAGDLRPRLALLGFAKVSLAPGEEREVAVPLRERSFAVWTERGWQVPGGSYRLLAGTSSGELPLSLTLQREGPRLPELTGVPDWYRHPSGAPSHGAWEALLGRAVAENSPPPRGQFTMDCSLVEMKETSRLAALAFRMMEVVVSAPFGWRRDYRIPRFRMLMSSGADAPLRSLRINGGIRRGLLEGALELLNGRWLSGLNLLARWLLRR